MTEQTDQTENDRAEQHAEHLKRSRARLMLFAGRRPATVQSATGWTEEQVQRERLALRDAGLDGGAKRHPTLDTKAAAFLLDVLPRRVRALCEGGTLGQRRESPRGPYYEITALQLLEYGRSADRGLGRPAADDP